MIMIIAGLIIGPAYSIVFQALGLGTSEDRMELIRAGLAEHYRIMGRLPRPADITAAPGDADYDTEAAIADLIVTAGVGSDVYIGAVPIEALRIAMGCDSTASLLDWQIAALRNRIDTVRKKFIRNNEDVSAGNDYEEDESAENNVGLKYNCVTKNHILDEYGNKFLYAVSENATDLSLIDPNDVTTGQIQITKPGTGSVTPGTRFWFIVVSHGENGRGAYDENGNLSAVLCNNSAIKEYENCDNDRRFLSQHKSLADNNDFYDDVVDYSLSGVMDENDFWNMREVSGRTKFKFNPNGRLIITNTENMGAVSAGDAVVVETGNVRISSEPGVSTNGGSIQTQSVDTTGTVKARNDVEVEGAGGAVYAPAYNY